MKTFIKLLAISFLITSAIDAQIKEDTVEVGTGWNMIGALHTGLASEIVRSEPPDIITSAFFGYNPGGGYESKDTLKKGRGYWVKVNEDGMIIFYYTVANLPPYQPSNPDPANHSTGIDTNIILSWTCSDPDNDPITYDVYFGTDNPPVTKVSSDQTGTYLVRNGLLVETTYYWKVVAKDDHSNSTSGPVWEFTTKIGGTSCPGIPTVYYEGKTYNTVLIGNQCWLRENLDIGVRIDGSQDMSNNGTIEKYCYNDSIENCNIYGGLYQWNEAMQYSTTPGSRGICPSGWHIPTREEFETLSNTVVGDGNALKAVGQGSGVGAGTNTSGFSALLGGFRSLNGVFYNLSLSTDFWSSTEYGSYGAFFIALIYYNSDIPLSYDYKENGFSVRCLQD